MKRILLYLYVGFKYLFGTSLSLNKEGSKDSTVISVQDREKAGEQKMRRFLEILRMTDEVTVTIHDKEVQHHFDTNYRHLDDGSYIDSVVEVVGLIYEKDGKTPKNAADMYDMTYQTYEEYKETVLPIATERRITEKDIEEFLLRGQALVG